MGRSLNVPPSSLLRVEVLLQCPCPAPPIDSIPATRLIVCFPNQLKKFPRPDSIYFPLAETQFNQFNPSSFSRPPSTLPPPPPAPRNSFQSNNHLPSFINNQSTSRAFGIGTPRPDQQQHYPSGNNYENSYSSSFRPGLG